MKLIFTTNWSIYLSIVIHFIFKSSNAILMVGFTNFLIQSTYVKIPDIIDHKVVNMYPYYLHGTPLDMGIALVFY